LSAHDNDRFNPDQQLMGPTGKRAEVESNGAWAVNIQDQHSRALDLDFIKVLAPPTTTASVASKDGFTVDVTNTAGFADGVVVGISLAGEFYFGHQVGAIAGSTITLDTPFDQDFSAGANIFPATKDMNVNGSVTTQIFQIGPAGSVEIDITRIMGYIQTNSTMDDALFGNLTALTKGIVLRVSDTKYQNIWNMKSNGQLGIMCFDTEYTDKAPAGSFGFKWRNSYAGQDKHGVTIRLAAGDILQILIQDDLSSLELFHMMAQGHYVTD